MYLNYCIKHECDFNDFNSELYEWFCKCFQF